MTFSAVHSTVDRVEREGGRAKGQATLEMH